MKVSELLNEKMEYDSKRGVLFGDAKEWLVSAGIKQGDKEFFNKALKELKKTRVWDVMTEIGIEYIGTQRELANGTLSFSVPGKTGKYIIQGHGQIRLQSASSRESRTRLKSPKPTMVVGDPLKSIIKTWENSLWELIDKHKKKLDAIEKRIDTEQKERN